MKDSKPHTLMCAMPFGVDTNSMSCSASVLSDSCYPNRAASLHTIYYTLTNSSWSDQIWFPAIAYPWVYVFYSYRLHLVNNSPPRPCFIVVPYLQLVTHCYTCIISIHNISNSILKLQCVLMVGSTSISVGNLSEMMHKNAAMIEQSQN